jgi:RNA exonuclease 4
VDTLRVLIPALWSLFVAILRGDVARRVRSNLTVSRHPKEGGGGGSNTRTRADDGVAYVDGSVNRGFAGIGIWYGVGHHLNYAAAIPAAAADNNVAELIAVFVALIRHPRDARLAIHTDSRACATTLESLASGAKPRDLAPRNPARRALLEALLYVLFWRDARTVLHKIKGHAGQTPNERADRLASLGAHSSFAAAVPGFGDGVENKTPRVHGKERSLGVFPGARLRAELVRFLAREPGAGAGAIGDDRSERFAEKNPQKKRTPNGVSPKYKGPLRIPVPLDANEEITCALALDCEMVGVGPDGEKSILAQVSIVNESGNVVYTSYAAPTRKVTDYRTRVSGILPRHVENAPSFAVVRDAVKKILEGKTVVGHALENDFEALQLKHPSDRIRDTAHWRPFLRMGRFSKRLRHLARDHCGLKIQGGSHDPAEDARAAMYLYLKYRENWEGQVWATRQGRDGRGR